MTPLYMERIDGPNLTASQARQVLDQWFAHWHPWALQALGARMRAGGRVRLDGVVGGDGRAGGPLCEALPPGLRAFARCLPWPAWPTWWWRWLGPRNKLAAATGRVWAFSWNHRRDKLFIVWVGTALARLPYDDLKETVEWTLSSKKKSAT